jgi:hypothetical protein
MDTLSRHKSFLLASAVLLLASIFSPQTDHLAEDIVPVESHIKPEAIVRCFWTCRTFITPCAIIQSLQSLFKFQLPTTTTTSHSMDPTTAGQSTADSKAINADACTIPRDTKLDPKCALYPLPCYSLT